MQICFKFIYILIFTVFSYQFVYANREEPSDNVSLEIDQKKSENNIELVHNLIDLGEYEKAKLLLLKIDNLSNEDEEVYNLLGYVERQLQNFSSAIRYYKIALSINNDYSAAHHYLSMAYLEMDQLDKAKIHRDQLDLICLFGCTDFTEVDNAIKMYEKNNGR